MKLSIAVVLAAVCMLFTAGGTLASAVAPPPPPDCGWCSGPPGVPVPTVPPNSVAPIGLISVTLSPTHMERGHGAKLEITADADDAVISSVQYHDGKPTTYRSKVGDSGTLTVSWKVPSNAPLGKAQLKVTVQGSGDPYTTLISFEVTR